MFTNDDFNKKIRIYHTKKLQLIILYFDQKGLKYNNIKVRRQNSYFTKNVFSHIKITIDKMIFD